MLKNYHRCLSDALFSFKQLNADKIFIEDNVTISYRVTFVAHGRKTEGWKTGLITLKKGCYIGAGAIILRDVTIGENAVVGAGAVVTKSVDPDTVVVGVPAKPLQKSL